MSPLRSTAKPVNRSPTGLGSCGALHDRNPLRRRTVEFYRSRTALVTTAKRTEVLLWGDTNSIGSKPQMIAVAHRISKAAATFKTHALTAAAGAKPSTDLVVEMFLATRATWQPPHTQLQTDNAG
jgi:hypothetical protein